MSHVVIRFICLCAQAQMLWRYRLHTVALKVGGSKPTLGEYLRSRMTRSKFFVRGRPQAGDLQVTDIFDLSIDLFAPVVFVARLKSVYLGQKLQLFCLSVAITISLTYLKF